MTISYVGGDTVSSSGAQALTPSFSGISYQAGDFAIVFAKQSENTGAQIWDDDGGGGNGWTRNAYNRTTSGRDQETAIYTKVLTASESDPTFTWNSGGTNEQMTVIMVIYRSSISGAQLILADLGYLAGTNDCNPPNASVTAPGGTITTVVFHAATHDDISSVGAPTNFTIREYQYGGSAGHTQDHRDSFSADRLNHTQSAGSYTPGAWTHGASNSTPEWHCYTAILQEVSIAIDDQGDEQLDTGDTNEIIDGFGFEASQGTGKVELGDDPDYATATKVTQTIDSWSDTQIQFDPVFTGFSDGPLWVFVTNDSGDTSAGYKVNFGNAPYGDVLNLHDYDIIHSFDNTYDDTGARNGNYAANGQVTTAPVSFKSESGVPGGNTHCWGPDSATGKIEMADTPYTNVTNQHGRREIIGWIKLPATPYKEATVIWEEGGGVNNIYFALGPGNALFFNVADSNGSPDFKVQAYGDFTLTPERWYHIRGILECGVGIQGVELRIDNVTQGGTAGDLPITDTTMSTHSGDYAYGDADGNLDTGGTDIAYAGANGNKYAWWATASNSGGGAPVSDTDREEDFILGAPPTDTVVGDSEVNMQSDVGTDIDDTTYTDVPLAIKINRTTEVGGDVRLEFDNVVMGSRTSAHVLWLGTAGETLTIVNNGTSNIDAAKCFSPYGGSIVIENPATFTVAGVIVGAELRIYDDNGSGGSFGDELDGIETAVSTSFAYPHDGSTNDILVQMMATGYEEVLVPFTLGSSDQTLTLNPTPETNL